MGGVDLHDPAMQCEGARPLDGTNVRLWLLDATSFVLGVTLLRYEPVTA